MGTILDNEELDYFTLAPCRLVDTRDEGSAALVAGSTQSFEVASCSDGTVRLPDPGCICGIPDSAKAIAFTVTVVAPTDRGHLTLFPDGAVTPPTSTINFDAGVTRSNNGIITLGSEGRLSVRCGMQSGSTHATIDVLGYFE